MIEIGKIQTLQVMRRTPEGAYLNFKDGKDGSAILLPRNQEPREFNIGDEIEVFVYTDSEGDTVATVRKPKLTIGELGLLRVVETTKFGAFLDWGLPKDLLLPLKEQVAKISTGDLCLVGLYINNNNKICATMHIYNLLSSESPYKKNDRVSGTVYSMNGDFGLFVAVDNKYHGLVHKNELFGNYKEGDQIEVRVKK
ncbi:hypothetical protein N752_11795 [Desulforamulus aquiferis]|nr:hypothetical protein N752_11795 [Desulforamulus aquiferis]